MCYHNMYLFLGCGHSIPSLTAIPPSQSPPCPARTKALFGQPSLSSPISPTGLSPWFSVPTRQPSRHDVDDSSSEDSDMDLDDVFYCTEKLSHPLHTYRIESLCLACLRQREVRLAKFEVGMIKEDVQRELTRKANARKEAMECLRSGYQEGRREKEAASRPVTQDGPLVDLGVRVEHPHSLMHAVKSPVEAIGFKPGVGAFEGARRRSSAWARNEAAVVGIEQLGM